MKKQKVIIVGNKQYNNFNFNNIVDSFDIIYRFNCARPDRNTGMKFGKLAMCSHMYENLTKKPFDKELIMRVYGSEMEFDFLNDWCDWFQKNIENFDEIFYERIDTHSLNKTLEGYSCPHRFSKMASTGFSIIFKNLLLGNKICVIGFSLNEQEIRKTQGEIDEFAKSKNLVDSCHSFSEERDILAWLHNNKKIDASLCMIEDTEGLSLKKNTYNTQPSEYIMRLIDRKE